ncbi:hypothetical protein GCWU000325_00663 [Alloprevotella tannerae ATCC 51259]|uniref:Uncharacterized protein n=1 Tax=Alloprevotella tannerae ATCC 51259 TaxID=626522 RepID=C9LEN3_9BACT|nr:hypothetical protein GCWU000325_00663 [Alloprevotella tannerae ATCC 51259]
MRTKFPDKVLRIMHFYIYNALFSRSLILFFNNSRSHYLCLLS